MAPVIRTAAGHCPGSRCRWRPTGPECSPQGTCAAGRSNAAPRPSARDQWRWRSSTGGWRRRAVTEPSAVASPDAAVSSEFTELASDEQIATAAAALERNGIRPLLAATGADARGLVGSLLVDGAEVYNNTSQTLEAIGVADDIERSGRYQPLRLRLYRMDGEMPRREMRTLAASPDYVVGCGACDPGHRRPEDRRRCRNRDAAYLRILLPARGCPGPAGLRSAQRSEQHPHHQQGGHPRPGHRDHRQRAPRLLITVMAPLPPAGWA